MTQYLGLLFIKQTDVSSAAALPRFLSNVRAIQSKHHGFETSWDISVKRPIAYMGLLPDTWNCWLRMRWECRERFPRHRLQRKLLVSDPGMHHGTCVTHVPWCMSGSLTRGGGENVPGIPDACATRNFTYLARGLWIETQNNVQMRTMNQISAKYRPVQFSQM